MCGIIGIGFLGSLSREEEIVRQEVAQYFLTELLVETQVRGEDATGVSIVFDNGHYIGLKSGFSAVDFITKKNEDKDKTFTGFMNIWSSMVRKKKGFRDAKIVLAHCRKTSVGNAYNNFNNHPIHVDPIIGIHNGTLTNDDVVFEKLGCKRDGQVDSEAIVQLSHKFTRRGELPFTKDIMKNVGERLAGSFTTLIANSNNPYQIGFIREDRPMEICLVKKLNMIVIVSDDAYFKKVLFRYMKLVDVFPSMFDKVNTGWPSLCAEDVSFRIMPNREVGFFDLTNLVDKDKNVPSDFYIGDTLPRTLDDWKEVKTYTTKTNYGGNHNHANGYGHNKQENSGVKVIDKRSTALVGVSQTESDKTKTQTSDSTIKDRIVGKLWVNSLKKFRNVSSKDIEDVSSVKGFVELEIVDGASSGNEKENKEGVITSISGPMPPASRNKDIKIEERVMGATEKDTPTKEQISVSEYIDRLNKELDLVSVDMSNDPIAIEFAKKYTDKLDRFSSEEDVAGALGLSSAQSVASLASVPLVNRSLKKFSNRAFHDGFVYARKYFEYNKESGEEPSNDGIVIRKGKKRDIIIKNYKLLTTMLSEVIEGKNDEKTIGSTEDYINSVIKKHKKHIDVEAVRRIFSSNSMRKDNNILSSMYEKIISGTA